MRLLRLSLALLPVIAGVVTWWAARTSTQVRKDPEGHGLTIMLPGAMPLLNPFWQSGEIERQIVDLLHQPMVRIGQEGHLQPGLAAGWGWSQRVTCWFANADIARSAAEHLQSLDADRWIEWQLDEVNPQGTELSLKFASPDPSHPDAVLRELASFDPLPIDFIRVSAQDQMRAFHAHFLKTSVEQGQIRRTWFDADHTAEFVISGTPGNAVEEMRQYYESRPDIGAQLTLLGRVAALREPVLEFRLKPDATWPDKTPVTSADAAATARYVIDSGWPVPNHESFRQIQSLDTPQPDRLRIVYRDFLGAALCGWVDFPILPASWLERNPPDTLLASLATQVAPGAGDYQVTARRGDALILDPKNVESPTPPRLRFQAGANDFVTQAGFATRTIDVFWPPLDRLAQLRQNPDARIVSAPPRSRLMVVWNTHHPALKDARVRRAFLLGTDRSALIEDLVPGAGGLHDGVFKPDLWYTPATPITPHDPEAAAELLDAAGWLTDVTTGLRKRPEGTLKINLLTTAGNEQREALARLLATQWNKLGAEVEIQAVSWDEMIDQKLLTREFDAAILGFDFETSWDQLPLWHSSQARPGGLNFSGLSDRQTDLLLETLRTTFNPDAVPAIAEDLQKRLTQLSPVLPLFTDLQPAVLRSSLKLPGPMPDSRLTLRALALPPEADKPTPAPHMRLPEKEDENLTTPPPTAPIPPPMRLPSDDEPVPPPPPPPPPVEPTADPPPAPKEAAPGS